MTLRPKALARGTTRAPMLPVPITPSVLPCNSRPEEYFFFSHLPPRVLREASGTRRASASKSASVCSATEMLFPPGAFITTTPRRVAAGRSMLSTPVPARPITRRRGAAARISGVTLVALRTASASYPPRISRNAAGSRPTLVSTCAPGMRSRMIFASGERSSAMRILIYLSVKLRCAAARPAPRATLAPRSWSPRSMAPITTSMSKSSKYPRWAMRKIFPLAASWPPTSLIPYSLKRCLTSFSESTPSGASTVVIAGDGLFEYSVRPSACIAARAARAMRSWRGATVFRPPPPRHARDPSQPPLPVHGQRLVQALHQRDGRRPGRLVLALAVALAANVEVEPGQVGRLVQLPRLLGGGEEGDPGRQPQRLVPRAEQHVDTPGVHGQRHRAQRTDGVHHQNRARPGRHLRQLLHRMVDAGGALVGLNVDRLGAGVVAERLLHRGRFHRLSPVDVEIDRLHAVGLGQLPPALAELAAVDHHRLVALAQEVGERRLHGAGAAGGEDQHVLPRLEQPLQALADASEEGLELRRGVVQDGPRHPQGEPLRNRRRTRSQKADLLHGF